MFYQKSKMGCPLFPESQNMIGLLLGFLAFYWFSTMSQLEVILFLRFLSLALICLAIYWYCTMSCSVEIMIISDENCSMSDDSSSGAMSEELEEVKEMVDTPAPESLKEETAEFADLVKPKKIASKRRNNAK